MVARKISRNVLSEAKGAFFNLMKMLNTRSISCNTCWRRILRIWWPQRIRNEISQVTGLKEISDEIRRRRWNVLRKARNDDCMVAMKWQPEEEWGDLKPHGQGRWKRNPGTRDGAAGAQRKTGLVGERKLQPYAPHGVERTN